MGLINNNLVFNVNSNSNLQIDENGDIVYIPHENITYTYSADGDATISLNGDIAINGMDNGYTTWGTTSYTPFINLEDVKQQYTVDDILDAYSVEEFENAIRKRKLNRIMGKNE